MSKCLHLLKETPYIEMFKEEDLNTGAFIMQHVYSDDQRAPTINQQARYILSKLKP